MLKHLKRWLGWEGESSLLDLVRLGSRSRSAPPPPKPLVTAIPTRRAEQPAAPRPAKERDTLEVLDNPRLSLDKPADESFDPYNTGAFNRSASWERIGRQRKR